MLFRARLGPARSTRPPIRDGWVDDRTAGSHRRRWAQGPAPPSTRRQRPRATSRILPGLVNAHTHLELSVDARTGAAAPIDASSGFGELVRHAAAARIAADGGCRRRSSTPRSPKCATRARRWSATSATRSTTLPAARAKRRSAASSSTSCSASTSADPARDASTQARAAVDRARPGRRASRDRRSRRTRRTRSSPPLFARDRAPASRAARSSAFISASRPRRSSSSGPAAGRGASCSKTLGAWNPAWQPPGCDPVEYLARLGYLQRGVLAVHGVQLTDDELARLRDAGAIVVTCPRSNAWVGRRRAAESSRFYASGVRWRSAPTASRRRRPEPVRRAGASCGASRRTSPAGRAARQRHAAGRATRSASSRVRHD